MSDELARHLAQEQDGELHPEGCYYCGSLHLSEQCPNPAALEEEFDEFDEDFDDFDEEDDVDLGD
jgi:hypothetical protein